MEAMLGMSLYSYVYLKLAKHYVFLIISYVFFLTKLEKVEQVMPGVGEADGEWGVAQTMYTHVSKCKNNNKHSQHTIKMPMYPCLSPHIHN
jgi:hypothetical protein